jgi:hypothetical protein
MENNRMGLTAGDKVLCPRGPTVKENKDERPRRCWAFPGLSLFENGRKTSLGSIFMGKPLRMRRVRPSFCY